jgi:hypothetical protein
MVRASLAGIGVALIVIFGAGAAPASEVTTERRAGGLVFKKTDTIAITNEELFVSLNQVRVAYAYQSKAAAVQKVTMAFSLPSVPIDDSPDSVIFSEDRPDPRNYMDFKVKVDGEEVKAKLSEAARMNNKDITARLVEAGVPLIFVRGGQEAVAQLPKATRDRLLKQRFLTGEANAYRPHWTYHVVMEWEQSFRPGATKVEISYKPIVGDSTDYGDYYDSRGAAHKYCIDAEFRANFKRRRQAGAAFEVSTLGYVLKTANFSSGPIGSFRLVVDKGKPANLVAFCPADRRKISETQFEWTVTKFTPQRDLDVVFFVEQ